MVDRESIGIILIDQIVSPHFPLTPLDMDVDSRGYRRRILHDKRKPRLSIGSKNMPAYSIISLLYQNIFKVDLTLAHGPLRKT